MSTKTLSRDSYLMIRATSFFIFVFLSTSAFAGGLEINIAYFGGAENPPYLGVVQGISEANLQGEFLGQKYIGKNYVQTNLIPVKDPKPSAILADVDVESLRILSQLNPSVPIFNLSEAHDIVRKLCLPNVFHVIPSAQMKIDAEAQWKKKTPDSKAIARAWHSDFKKYAAKQLNNRFREASLQTMDDYSWAGWAAVKILAEAVVRTGSTDPEKLMVFLKNDLVFDGNKGVKMTFRSTGQLRQLLIMVEGGKIVGEAPVVGVVDRHDLDSLGFNIDGDGECK